jgi:5'-3' exonuclease
VSGSAALDVHLVDGTYELFRHYYAVPSARDAEGREVGAVRGVLASILGMINGGATHLAVATDHVIESFRNGLWRGYKTSAGVEPNLLSQFPLLEDMLTALGVVVWPMTEFEADDALAAGAAASAADGRVRRVIICTPDKDLAQCVRGTRVVQLNRRTRVTLDEGGVIAKFGVPPASIPDYLALVGDAADGFPGVAGVGPKTAAQLIGRYGPIEAFPPESLRDARTREEALLFKRLAILRSDAPLFDDVDALRWRGPTAAFAAAADRIGDARLLPRIAALESRIQDPRSKIG